MTPGRLRAWNLATVTRSVGSATTRLRAMTRPAVRDGEPDQGPGDMLHDTLCLDPKHPGAPVHPGR
jgi:hypothetical protein